MKPHSVAMPGRFFSLDGIDGTGKTTQLRLLAEWLIHLGHQVECCVDPGGTTLGQQLRSILLDRSSLLADRTEALLFMASRAQLVEEKIKPALQDGKIVLSDRYLLANVVYQGYASGLPISELWQIGEFATQGIHPELSLILDIPVELSLQRLAKDLDRMEARDLDWKKRVRDGFLACANKIPERYRVVDAAATIEEVQQRLRHILTPLVSKPME